MERRKFLKDSFWITSSILVAPFLPYSQKTWAENTEPHYLVLLRASGGAHAPLGLDPLKITDLENRELDPVKIDLGDSDDLTRFYAAYRDSDLIDANGILLGVAGQPLVPHINDIAIVNGVMLLPQSPFHDVCLRYSSTGNTNEDSPLFPYQVEMEMQERSSMGVAYNGFLNQELKQKYFGTPVNDIRNGASGYRSPHLDILSLQSQHTENSGLSGAMTALLDAKSKEDQFVSNMNDYQSLQTGFLPQDMVTVAAGFNSNFFQFASIDLNTNGTLDTHNDHGVGHAQSLTNVFQQIADIFTLFKNIPCNSSTDGKSLFDQTTFVFTSDFCRSSWKQGRDGTDHNPLNNSFLLAGKKIKGGQKIGASTVITPALFPSDPRSRLQALPFDFGSGRALTLEETVSSDRHRVFNQDTGQVILGSSCQRGNTSNCVDLLTPGSIYKTLGQAFGIEFGTRYTNNEKTISTLLKDS